MALPVNCPFDFQGGCNLSHLFYNLALSSFFFIIFSRNNSKFLCEKTRIVQPP